MLDDRSNKIQDSLRAADEARNEAESSAEKVEQELTKARKEGQNLISDARQAAGQLRETELSKAKKEADSLIEKAKGEIVQEKNFALQELRREFSGLAILVAEKIVRKSLNEKDHQDLIDDLINDVIPSELDK